MPFEVKNDLSKSPIRKGSTDQVKGEVAPGFAVKQGELVAFATTNLIYGPLTDSATGATTITFTNASNVVNWASHGLATGTAIEISGGTTAPTRAGGTGSLLVPGIYYVKTVASDGTFTISETVGGADIDLTSDGSGTFTGKVVPAAALNYLGLIVGASSIDNAVAAGAKADFRNNLLGVAAYDVTSSQPGRQLIVHTHAVIEYLTDDTAMFPVGAPVKLKDNSAKYANPFKWTLAANGTDEIGYVVEQSPLRFDDYAIAAAVKAGTTYPLTASAAPVKVAAVLKTRFN